MSEDLTWLDATALAELVREGEVSPLELVDAAIERIERVNPEINAVIHPSFEEARDAARGELPDGPFRGVPFLLKDLGSGADAGQPLHMGMRLLKEADFRAPVTSYLVQRLRAAGLVIVGRTSTPELGILPTTEPVAYGPTRNPWDTSRSSGGSSGGSGAAVAAGMVPFAHASDGGGSIRIPASHCGLVGLKPTRARVTLGPLTGDSMSGLTTELAVSRSVRDTAAILDAVQGPGPGDPYVAPAPERPYVEELGADPGRLRVALRTGPFMLDQEIEPAVVEGARAAGSVLEELGHEVDEAPELPAADRIDIVDTFLTRWMAGQASVLDQFAALLGRAVRREDVEPLTWALADEGNRRSAGKYLSAVSLHQLITRAIAGIFESGVDLLVTPTTGEPAPPLGTYDDSGPDPMAPIYRGAKTAAFTALFNATGQPALSLPLHWTEDGLPVGVQLVASYGSEDLLIRVASQLEQAQPWRERTPPLFAAA
jgi:amidase